MFDDNNNSFTKINSSMNMPFFQNIRTLRTMSEIRLSNLLHEQLIDMRQQSPFTN